MVFEGYVEVQPNLNSEDLSSDRCEPCCHIQKSDKNRFSKCHSMLSVRKRTGLFPNLKANFVSGQNIYFQSLH